MSSWFAIVVAPLLSLASVVAPDELAERARFAERDLDYDRAADLWLEVIGHPDTDDALRFEANLQAGAIERIRGNDTEARFHFQYVLRKAPDHRLPDDTPPKVKNFFELVRQEVKAEAARSVPVEQQGGGDRTAEVRAPPTTTATSVPAPTTSPHESAPPAGALVDDGGGISLLPLALIGGGMACAGFAISALGAGALVGLFAVDRYNQAVASNVQVERHDFYEAAQGAALVANVSFFAASLTTLAALSLAGTGGVLWLIE